MGCGCGGNKFRKSSVAMPTRQPGSHAPATRMAAPASHGVTANQPRIVRSASLSSQRMATAGVNRRQV